MIQFYRNLFSENRHWLKLVTNWFLLAAIFGGITFFIKPDLLQVILKEFADRFGENPDLNFAFALQIFSQNIIASLIVLFGFVIVSMFSLTNVLSGVLIIVTGLVPHGIFELPAVLIAAALGLRFGTEWLRQESKGHRGEVLKNNLIRAIVCLPAIALVLFIAALIEVFASGKLVGN